MDRKTFVKKTIGAFLVTVPSYYLLGCSGDDSPSEVPDPDPNPMSANCLENGANASSISGNHGHSLVVSKDDIDAGVEKDYSIQGSSGHNHDIRLTANNFTSLKGNTSITVVSTTGDGHTHNVTVSCA